MVNLIRINRENRCIGCGLCELACARANYKSHSLTKSAIHIRTGGGLGEYTQEICMGCKDPPCITVCPTDALTLRKGGGVFFNSEKCIECKLCIKECILNAIRFDEDTDKIIVCNHCGICSTVCPHDCLYLEKVKENNE